MGIDRNAPSVVRYTEITIGVQFDFDPVRMSGYGLIHGIVDDFCKQMMKGFFVGTTDIHAGTTADGLKTLQNLDIQANITQLQSLIEQKISNSATHLHKHETIPIVDLSIGLLIIVLVISLLCVARYRQRSLFHLYNDSVNIVNVHFYTVMQLYLSIEVIFLTFINAIQIYALTQGNQFSMFMDRHFYLIRLAALLLYQAREFLFLMIPSFQFFEWLTLVVLIRWEQKMDIKCLMKNLKSQSTSVNIFNKREIAIKNTFSCYLIIYSLIQSIGCFYSAYQILRARYAEPIFLRLAFFIDISAGNLNKDWEWVNPSMITALFLVGSIILIDMLRQMKQQHNFEYQ